MNILYICKISAFQARGNQIDIPKKVATDFFNVPLENIEDSLNTEINICHISNLSAFEIIEIQPATNVRWSTKLNKFLSENGDNLQENNLLVFEKLGRSYCVHTISNTDRKYEALIDLFEEGEKHMLLSSSTNINKEDIQQLKADYRPYLTAIRTKPFLLLAGISGTGKSRIVRELAFKSCPKCLQDENGTTPGNYCMIEVKPNWHDSTELLGYYSNLSGKYLFTKFAKFLIKAKMYPDVPFFVCLDEMNLAPVEQYFAEILSVLETRKMVTLEDGTTTIKTGAIIDAEHFKALEEIKNTNPPAKNTLSDRSIYLKLHNITPEMDDDHENPIYKDGIIKTIGNRHDLTTEGLTLPDNVIIIGTVNMDDTTHQFSRKVIDRAMTIEMNGGKLKDMFGGSKRLAYLEEVEQQKWQGAFKQYYVSADEVLQAHKDKADEIIDVLPTKLEAINLALKGTPFEVSYRVLNELTIMVGVMLDDEPEVDLATIADRALDRILLMKVLPRIEGDSDLFNLKTPIIVNGVKCSNRLEWLRELAPVITVTDEEGNPTEHPQTAKEKIQEMVERLDNQEFTRFWP